MTFLLLMGKFEKYKIDLKGMQAPLMSLEYDLDNQFFADIDAPEVGKGKAHVALEVKKQTASDAFELSFDIEGVVVIQCDRCLDDMEQEIAISDRLMVKLGTEYSEEDDKKYMMQEAKVQKLVDFLLENATIKEVAAEKARAEAAEQANAAAAKKAQDEVNALEAYVGTIPEGYETQSNIVAFIQKRAEEILSAASGGSRESAASVLAALNAYKSENDPKV